MADSYVQVAADSSGKKIDNSEMTIGANTVYRQRVNIGDPSSSGLAVISLAAPAMTDPALAVRDVAFGGTTGVTVTPVNASTSTVVLLAANTSRRLMTLYNDTVAASLYVSFSTAASTGAYTLKILTGGFYEMAHPIYQGAVSGIWSASSGAVLVTEL